jgi:hypothetical protein
MIKSACFRNVAYEFDLGNSYRDRVELEARLHAVESREQDDQIFLSEDLPLRDRGQFGPKPANTRDRRSNPTKNTARDPLPRCTTGRTATTSRRTDMPAFPFRAYPFPTANSRTDYQAKRSFLPAPQRRGRIAPACGGGQASESGCISPQTSNRPPPSQKRTRSALLEPWGYVSEDRRHRSQLTLD